MLGILFNIVIHALLKGYSYIMCISLCFAAVVGAGIGGSAVTYFLHQQFGPQVQIDVYEADRVGGRLATLTVNSQQYECGNPSVHSLNLHMQDFVKLLGESCMHYS